MRPWIVSNEVKAFITLTPDTHKSHRQRISGENLKKLFSSLPLTRLTNKLKCLLPYQYREKSCQGQTL
jgi:hypothetical protein